MSTTKVSNAIEKADEFIASLCVPGVMTPQEAIDYQEGLIERLEMNIEALKEENDL